MKDRLRPPTSPRASHRGKTLIQLHPSEPTKDEEEARQRTGETSLGYISGIHDACTDDNRGRTRSGQQGHEPWGTHRRLPPGRTVQSMQHPITLLVREASQQGHNPA
ncbi:hypothetical protein GCM10018791_63450 [Streptomyces zaomyceticus]|nr:hypothetical protein GCM10018791_63450 [Streptomyces zaomyceticus]